ncbi:MAG: hypothetical protein A2007_06100 [Verrucomicrobia bacterium GWC2_42_7]|nr:MAG: hypothetical protein A2007_06100 [Verrucomicrobia bacterium GWC2_42_7]
MKKIHNRHRANLRQRFLQAGFNGFVEHEIVELLLTLCIPRKDVKGISKELVKEFGSLRGILEASPQNLQKVKGIGNIAATSLKIIKETANVYLHHVAEDQPVFDSFKKIENFWKSSIGCLDYEVFEVASLDSQLRLLRNGVDRIAEGTVDQAAVYPRKVIESALTHSASAIIVAHNHPSGRPEPSEYDKQLTDVLQFLCTHLGIRFIDHLIFSPSGTFSFFHP